MKTNVRAKEIPRNFAMEETMLVLFRAEYKPRGYYLEHFWQADLGYIGQAIIGVKVPNSSHVACIQHGRVCLIFDLACMLNEQ